MKHSLQVTLMLITLFLVSQIIGLGIVNKDITVFVQPNGTIETYHISEEIVGEPPIQEKSAGFLYIMGIILLGTGIVFVLIRFKVWRLWKVWFFIAIVACLSLAFSVLMNYYLALGLAVLIGLWRVFRPNVYIHNFAEVFMYSGIALILVQWLNLFAGFMLLLLISIYDMIAVWKSKHMIKLAKFQTEAKTFAGMWIPYKKEGVAMAKTPSIGKKKETGFLEEKNVRTAILGGGDIGFPLVFAGIVMEDLILNHGVSKMAAYFQALFIPLFAGIALILLLTKGKEDRFYPAMPFISIGCVVGYLVILLF